MVIKSRSCIALQGVRAASVLLGIMDLEGGNSLTLCVASGPAAALARALVEHLVHFRQLLRAAHAAASNRRSLQSQSQSHSWRRTAR